MRKHSNKAQRSTKRTAQRTAHSAAYSAQRNVLVCKVYWCTLKSKYRAARIQLHHRVTVVFPAPVV